MVCGSKSDIQCMDTYMTFIEPPYVQVCSSHFEWIKDIPSEKASEIRLNFY